jgi:hypothetical protein
MNVTTRWNLVLHLSALLVVLPGCSGDAPETGAFATPDATSDAIQDSAAAAAASPMRAVLPGLFSIMVGLQGDLDRISHGLWLAELDAVAVAAQSVADHPRVAPAEFQRISGVLGADMSRFGGMDMEVHDLAVRLAEEATAGDLEAVLSTEAELRRACVACHTAFRERLRAEIR